jgi:ribosomal protein S6--L-glutamate ligase
MNRPGHVRIGFLLRAEVEGGAPYLSAVTREVVARLRERGAVVDLIVPENAPFDIADVRPVHDLYVLKEKSPLILGFAGALTVAGAVIVNTFASCSLTRDKIAATAVLAGAGVPVPPSWTTGQPSSLKPLLAGGPLWLKPSRGSRGEGVSRVTDPGGLDEQPAPTDVYGLPLPVFAQGEVPSTGRDLKVFVVGEEMWAITRSFPARTMEEKLGTPASVRPDIRTATLVCGRALGLELYGVDFLEAEDRFFAVDVNALPGYKGAPEAPRALADHLYHRAVRAAKGGGA